VFLAGLALDYCVAWSAQDAVRLGYDVTVIADACRSVRPEGDEATLRRLREAGVTIAQAGALSC
jgi:nicotinamidase/pyrazinamidase